MELTKDEYVKTTAKVINKFVDSEHLETNAKTTFMIVSMMVFSELEKILFEEKEQERMDA